MNAYYKAILSCILIIMLSSCSSVTMPDTTTAIATNIVPNYTVPIHGKGRMINTKSGRIYIETEGNGPPVFLIAGGPGGSHASFHPWFSRIAKQHTVVYFDNLGRGRSDRLVDSSSYTIHRDAEDIEAIREALGFESISIIGHSYGGMPALAYAAKYPTRVRNLVLSDTLLSAASWQRNIDNANAIVRELYPVTWEKLLLMRNTGLKSGDSSYQNLYGDAEGDLYWFNTTSSKKLFRSGQAQDKFNPDIYRAMLGNDPEWEVGGTMKSYLPDISAIRKGLPVLVIAGRYDRVAPPRAAKEIYDALSNQSVELVIFENSGHRPWLEETDAYFTKLEQHLKR